MKRPISPFTAGIAIIAVLALAVVAWVRFAGVGRGDPQALGIPPQVAVEFQQRQQGTAPPGR